MTITFIGHGYVGIVTACIFADFGNQVYVVGHTPDKIEKLKNGDPLIYEPGLKELLQKNLQANRLHFTLDFAEAIPQSDVVFIAVGTPPKKDGGADLSTVYSVAETIGKNLRKSFTVVSCKSTVPVGTNRKIEEIINKVKLPSVEFAVASCPEFLREGTGLHDTLNADRVVIGSYSKRAIDLLLKLHEPIAGKRVVTDLASAELIKYASNAMLATKISFANLISFYCERAHANVDTVLDAVGLDKRIGRIFLNPGIGYGGSCLPKDVKALINTGHDYEVDTDLLDAVEKINVESRNNLIKKVFDNIKGSNISIWGLSFKPETDDIREAPSTYLINKLLEKNYKINVYDPVAINNIKKIYGDKLTYSDNPYDTVKDTDALIIVTEWNEFKQIDLNRVLKLMKNPLIIDGRNIYDIETLKNLGFIYISTGKEPVNNNK